MADPRVWPGADKLVPDFYADGAAPVLSEVEPGPDREGKANRGERDCRDFNDKIRRYDTEVEPAKAYVVVEKQIKSTNNRNRVQKSRSEWCAFLRLFGSQP